MWVTGMWDPIWVCANHALYPQNSSKCRGRTNKQNKNIASEKKKISPHSIRKNKKTKTTGNPFQWQYFSIMQLSPTTTNNYPKSTQQYQTLYTEPQNSKNGKMQKKLKWLASHGSK